MGVSWGYAAAFFAGLFFGLSDSLVRAASRKLSPYSNLFISLLIGTPILWLSVAAAKPAPMNMEAGLAYLASGLLNFVAGRLLFYMAVSALGAASATVTTSPVTALSALLAWPLLGESLTAQQLLGVVLASVAVYIASSEPSGEPLHGEGLVKGIAAALGASLAFASATILVRYAAYHGGDPVAGTAISYTVALPFAAILVYAKKQHQELARISREHLYMTAAAISVSLAQLSRYYSLTELRVANAVVLIGLFPLHTIAFTTLLTRATQEKTKAKTPSRSNNSNNSNNPSHNKVVAKYLVSSQSTWSDTRQPNVLKLSRDYTV